MRKVLEKNVKTGINKYLNGLNAGHFFHYSAYMGVPGVADKIGLINGKFIAIEAKSPDVKGHKDGGLSATQLKFKKAVESNGGIFITAYHWHDVQQAFETLYLL